MKILLTGATGFVGRAFLECAINHGHHVASLVGPGKIAPEVRSSVGQHLVLRGTLADAPWSEIQEFGAHTCVHSAWITTPGVYLESPENDRFLAWSQEFLKRFFATGGSHVIGIGTCIEYQLGARVLSEATALVAPTTRYARCKDHLRTTLDEMAENARVTSCWARLFYPYGPGEHPDRLCSHLIKKMQQGERASLGTPQSVKDYIYIDDVAEALVTLVENRATGIFNLGSGEETTVMEMAQILARKLNAPVPVAKSSTNPPPAPDYVVADVSRLKALGWRSRVTPEEGLARLIASIESPGTASLAKEALFYSS